jgi:class III cytochrome C family protein
MTSSTRKEITMRFFLAFIVVLFAVVLRMGCGTMPAEETNEVGAGTIILKLPDEINKSPAQYNDLRRPPVRFDHIEHFEAYAEEGCQKCHLFDDAKKLIPKFMRPDDKLDREALSELYHAKCLDCHKQAEQEAPQACGECHLYWTEPPSDWIEISFDYSLHHRHVSAMNEKCQACHHVYDEKEKKLVYKKETESACSDCHGQQDVGKRLSLRNAAHTDCINCHLKRSQAKQTAGPLLCTGCHASEKQKAIKKLTKFPRLERGQPSTTWIKSPEAKSRLVPFNHERHEFATTSCSSCHHKTLEACSECHKLAVTGPDGAVTLERAYHQASSEHSCVGCHKTMTDSKNCAGCHYIMNPPPGQSACIICHSGPLPEKNKEPNAAPVASEMELDELPDASDDFPDEIVIDFLAKDYEPVDFPHEEIVTQLDKLARNNRLARRFHSYPDTLCAGCHHHSPVGTRPAPCSSCHDQEGLATQDKPDLFSAYHRQCIGCHQKMGLGLKGCTDCHDETPKEVSK